MRPSWDEYFLNIAKEVSTRATCIRAQHGCVLVKNRNIMSAGYNGAPPGSSHCTEEGCYMIDGHCKRCNHAEVNAICQSAMHGVPIIDSTAYVTGEPCCDCLRTLICAGISRIIYIKGGHYSFPEVENKLQEIFIKESRIEIKAV